jgi:FkbM family methyltransferase|tara:strand:+ start:396 stop:1097 length:702 start_codon:yes stop_codon:yes gene_type:complete
MANWRQKVVDWDAENANWGGEKELQRAIFDAKQNIKNLNLYGSGGNILDLGSNVGEFAINASKQFDNVFCYEAHPISYEVSLDRTKGINNIEIFNQPVWNESGKNLFISTPENSTGVTVRERKFYPNRKANYYVNKSSVSFSSLLEKHSPRVIKIDIEGSEYSILPKAKMNDNLEFISVEFHQPFKSPGRCFKFDEILNNLQSQNFIEIKKYEKERKQNVMHFTLTFKKQGEI